MILIDGKKAAAELREELKIEVSELKSKYAGILLKKLVNLVILTNVPQDPGS